VGEGNFAGWARTNGAPPLLFNSPPAPLIFISCLNIAIEAIKAQNVTNVLVVQHSLMPSDTPSHGVQIVLQESLLLRGCSTRTQDIPLIGWKDCLYHSKTGHCHEAQAVGLKLTRRYPNMACKQGCVFPSLWDKNVEVSRASSITTMVGRSRDCLLLFHFNRGASRVLRSRHDFCFPSHVSVHVHFLPQPF